MVEIFEKIFNWRFQETPKQFGLFHIVTSIIVIICCVFFGFLGKRHQDNDKKIRITIFSFGIMWFVIEALKQLLFLLTSHYAYEYIPLQFCSMPIYIALITPWIKNKNVQNAFIYFLGTFSLVAGVAVLIFPQTVFSALKFIGIHTMLWHGGMVCLGVYLINACHIGKSYTQLESATYVWLILILFATILNTCWRFFIFPYNNCIANFFFISPFATIDIPIFGNFQEKYGWGLYMLGYTFLSCFSAYLVFMISRTIHKKKNVG